MQIYIINFPRESCHHGSLHWCDFMVREYDVIDIIFKQIMHKTLKFEMLLPPLALGIERTEFLVHKVTRKKLKK